MLLQTEEEYLGRGLRSKIYFNTECQYVERHKVIDV